VTNGRWPGVGIFYRDARRLSGQVSWVTGKEKPFRIARNGAFGLTQDGRLQLHLSNFLCPITSLKGGPAVRLPGAT
jgi:hypothetical protein